MVDFNLEARAERVAQDLNTGNAQDAANVLREESLIHPRETGHLIERANQLTSPFTRQDDILVDRFGDVAVREKATGFEYEAGRLPTAFLPPVIIIGGWEHGHGPHRPEPFPHPHPIPFPHPRPEPFPHPHPGPGPRPFPRPHR